MTLEWNTYVAKFPLYIDQTHPFKFRAFKKEFALLKKFSKQYGYENPVKRSILARVLTFIADLFRWLFNLSIQGTHPDCLDFHRRLSQLLKIPQMDFTRVQALEKTYRALIQAASPISHSQTSLPESTVEEDKPIVTLRTQFNLLEQIKSDKAQTVQVQKTSETRLKKRIQSFQRYLEENPGQLSDFMSIFQPTPDELACLQAARNQSEPRP